MTSRHLKDLEDLETAREPRTRDDIGYLEKKEKERQDGRETRPVTRSSKGCGFCPQKAGIG